MEIHIRKNGKSTGPYSLEQVREALARGEVAVTDQAWHVGLKSWQSLAEVVRAEGGDQPQPVIGIGEKAPVAVTNTVGEWEALCPRCQVIVATPEDTFCPNCSGLLRMAAFGNRLQCQRCSTMVSRISCATCGAEASGSYIRRTKAVRVSDSDPFESASTAVCPVCGSHHTNRLGGVGCMFVVWFILGSFLLFIPTYIYWYRMRYVHPNTRCLACGHRWNAKVNRRW